MPFVFNSTIIPDVKLVTAKKYVDPRGYYLEMFKESDFIDSNIPHTFKQDSVSFSKKGTLRGLHFQKPPHAQAKLVSVVQGEIWDVAVDMRKESPTFGKWVGERLTADNGNMLYIPEGFAHGFCALSEHAIVVYKMSSEYMPTSEGGVLWSDIDLNITWPENNPIVSEKDLKLPLFKEAYSF